MLQEVEVVNSGQERAALWRSLIREAAKKPKGAFREGGGIWVCTDDTEEKASWRGM